MTTNRQHIETIIAFIKSQMDGEQVPPSRSSTIEGLAKAVEGLQKANRDECWQLLGLRALGAVIDRTRSAIKAEEILHKFIRGDGHA
jgi:hypothetical protein